MNDFELVVAVVNSIFALAFEIAELWNKFGYGIFEVYETLLVQRHHRCNGDGFAHRPYGKYGF